MASEDGAFLFSLSFGCQKIWISMRFVRAVFAFFCGDCPVFSTPTKAKATLPTKLGWSGARAVVVVVVLCFTAVLVSRVLVFPVV